MAAEIALRIDGRPVRGRAGQTIIAAADEAGIYIPRLCHLPELEPFGACRVCTVLANGRTVSACTQPIAAAMVVESDTEELQSFRKSLVELLFVEGNHFCMFCEKSGQCELQALGYRLGIAAPRYPFLWPRREVDASHPDILIDHDRCILCARCVRASRDLDGKRVFGFTGRGPEKRLAVNARARLADTGAHAADEAIGVCPVGALLQKRTAYRVPIGRRRWDERPIGSEIEGEGAATRYPAGRSAAAVVDEPGRDRTGEPGPDRGRTGEDA